MRPRVRQNRVRGSPYHLAAFTHGDDVDVECASSIALASNATCTRLNLLESEQQVCWLWFRHTCWRGEMGNAIDVEGLIRGGKWFCSVPS
jgi:hypothetical protein